MIGKIYRRLVRVAKGVIWRLMPALTLRFYKIRRLRHGSIVLLIHEGLGDLASMVAAIKEAAKEHERVYVVSRKMYFDAISSIFHFDDNIKNIPAREGKFKKYKISKKRLLVLKRYGYVIKVGLYDNDPVFRYPDSFYIKLGYSSSLASRRFNFYFLEYHNILLEEFLKRVGTKFVFFSNETTTGYLGTSKLDEIEQKYEIVAFTNDLRMRKADRLHDLSKLNENDFTRSLLNSLYVCYLAEYVIVSDAGLFNILIRLENKIDMQVLWRKHSQSLNKEIYGKYIEK